MANTISPNMGLIVPGVGTEPGPTWATDLNASLGILDQHNHSPGQGVQITPAGLDINADLSIGSNNLTNVKTVNFTAQLASLPGSSPNLGCIYVAGNELYYNDEAGNVVAITNMGSVNAGAGSITGLPSGTASASYSSGSQTFIWQSATSTAANMDGGSVTIREVAASAKGVKLKSPTSLAADYDLIFPAALPGSTSFTTIDTAGNIAASISTSGGIGTSNIANLAITTALINTGAVTLPKMASPNMVVTASCGSFSTSSGSGVDVTNLSATITTSGKPVNITFQPDGTGNTSYLANLSAANAFAGWHLFRDATEISTSFSFNGDGAETTYLAGGLNFIDTPAAGTYTYKLTATAGGGNINEVFFIVMVVREL